MSDQLKPRKIVFTGDQPMQFPDGPPGGEHAAGVAPEHRAFVARVAETMKAYREATKKLIDTKYAHLKELLPAHISNPGQLLVFCGTQGVLMRHERRRNDDPLQKVGFGWTPEKITDVTAQVSQRIIYCHTTNDFTPPAKPEDYGLEFQLTKGNSQTGAHSTLSATRICFNVVFKEPDDPPPLAAKPFCLFSMRNQLELAMEGEMYGESGPQKFLTRSIMRIPVGWDCIELYPGLEIDRWKPECAPLWAENDILGSVVSQQFRENFFNTLDPNAAARREAAALLKRFKELLDSDPDSEEVLQVFLRDNAKLLCPAHTKMWPKLAIGSKVTDFVFRDAVADYLLVELERSTHKLFRADGHSTKALTTAIGQIHDWRRYIQDNLRTVQDELGLKGITPTAKGLIVVGRSANLSEANRRKLRAMHSAEPILTIWTYDDVYDNAKAVFENLLGPICETGGTTQMYYLK